MHPKSLFQKVLVLLCAAGTLLGVQSTSSAATPQPGSFYVNGATGNDAVNSGTLAFPFKSIDRGMDEAFIKLPVTGSADTANLWTLFDNAVKYAVTTTTLPVTAGKKAALIVGHASLYDRSPDAYIRYHLEKDGFTVETIEDDMIAAGQFTIARANTRDLLVISQSAVAQLNALRGTTAPIINMQSNSWDNWGYFQGLGGAESGGITTDRQTSISLVAAGDPLAGAFSNGFVGVYAKSTFLANVATTVTAAAPSVVVVANSPAAATRPCLWRIPAGAALLTPGGTTADVNTNNTIATAPARVVGFFLYSNRGTAGSSQNTDFVFSRTTTTATSIVVAAGTYPILSPLAPYRNMAVQGGWNSAFNVQSATANPTIIDGQRATRGLLLRDTRDRSTSGANANVETVDTGDVHVALADSCTVDSFTFTKCAATTPGGQGTTNASGGVIYFDGRIQGPQILNCTFNNNQCNDRGGVVFGDTNYGDIPAVGSTGVTFKQCTFTSNTTINLTNVNSIGFGSVMGTNNGPRVTFDSCVFTTNSNRTITNGGGLLNFNAGGTRAVYIVNCLFYNNLSTGTTSKYLIGLNGAEATGRKHFISNNVFYNNTVTANMIRQSDSNATFEDISNNIFMNNIAANASTQSLYRQATTGTVNATVRNNLVFGNVKFFTTTNTAIVPPQVVVGINGNVSGNPLFLNAAANNFHISTTSLARDAGATVAAVGNHDFDQHVRPEQGGSIFDIGAFEFQPAVPNAARRWYTYY